MTNFYETKKPQGLQTNIKNLKKEFSLCEIDMMKEFTRFSSSKITFGETTGLENVVIENNVLNVFIRVTSIGGKRQVLVSKIHFGSFDCLWTAEIHKIKRFLYGN